MLPSYRSCSELGKVFEPTTSHQPVLGRVFPGSFFSFNIHKPSCEILRAVLTLCKPTVNVRSAMQRMKAAAVEQLCALLALKHC